MPPAAIRASVCRTTCSASPSRRSACWRRQNSSSAGCGNLGAAPKPPCPGSKLRLSAASACAGAAAGSASSAPSPAAGRGSMLASASVEPRGLLGDRGALLAIRGGDARQEIDESGQPVAGVLRKIGAAEERLAGGRQEHRQRPAAGAAREQRVRRLVDLVEVRPLLAVDLDVDEELVHHRGDRRVLERLVRHHVAPVAGRVADRQQHRLVLAPRALQRLGAPRIPVDRVVGVLQQVRAGLAREAVAHRCSSNAMRSKSAPRCSRRVRR